MATPDPNSDAWLDARLRDVSVPDDLVRNLQGIAVMGDDELDAALRDVPLPALLLWRLRRIVDSPTRLARMSQWAVAASLLLSIGLSYLGAMFLFLGALYPVAVESRPWLDGGEPTPIVMELKREPVQLEVTPPSALARLETETRDADEPLAVPPVELAGPARRTQAWPSTRMVAWDGPPSRDLLLDRELSLWPPAKILGAHSGFDDLPEPKRVPGLAPRGISPPLVRGFNIFFLRQHGVFPFVEPAMHPALCVSRVPLAVDTSSYDLARRYLEDGMLPPRGVLRTEEFLAAIDYEYPRPKRGSPLALHTTAGPSPFRGGDMKLLQIGVQAAQVYDKSRSGTRLTMVVDISASMQWGGRLDLVRSALRRLAAQLGTNDRISLVIFNEYASVVAEDVAPTEMDQLLAVFDGIPAEGSTNVGAGLRLAYAVAGRYAGTDQRKSRVMLLTDGLAELDGGTSGQIESRLGAAADGGIRLDAVDLSQEKTEERLDAQLTRFAAAGRGKVHRATNADQVRWAVLEATTGQSQLVVSEARLRVIFNPEAVLAYRLLGHEARGIAGLAPARTEASFRSGQSATALYELRLKPGVGEPVAVAELTWSDPRSGQPLALTRKLQRSDFTASLSQVPMPLQAATVVAQAAELLRGSPYAQVPRSAGGLPAVLELAGQVDSRLSRRASYRQFVTLLEQAAKARPYRSGGHNGP